MLTRLRCREVWHDSEREWEEKAREIEKEGVNDYVKNMIREGAYFV